jgi:hypothetical protein
VDDGHGVARSTSVAGLFGGKRVAVSSFCDPGVGAVTSACGDAFEDFGDGVRLRPVQAFGGKIQPGW